MGAPEVGSVEVRALASEAEVATYFELAAATFPGYQQFHSTPAPGGSVAAGWRRFVLETPGFEPARLRGAFRDGALLGGLIHEERFLYVGAARLRSGYLILSGAGDGAGAVEAAADCWPAALALLRRHARARPQPPAELRWPLPPDAPTYYLLADHLPLRSQTRSRPNAGWMARPADVEALLEGLLPLWRERWRRARLDWRGSLCLAVDGLRCRLRLTDGELARQAEPAHDERQIRLSPAALTQLVFGARPIAWLAAQPGQQVPPELTEVLAVLCPPGIAFYPFSNRC